MPIAELRLPPRGLAAGASIAGARPVALFGTNQAGGQADGTMDDVHVWRAAQERTDVAVRHSAVTTRWIATKRAFVVAVRGWSRRRRPSTNLGAIPASVVGVRNVSHLSNAATRLAAERSRGASAVGLFVA